MKHLKKHPLNDKSQKLSKMKKEDNTKAKEKKMSGEKHLAPKPKMGRSSTDPSNKKLDGEKFLAESIDNMPLLLRVNIKKLANIIKTSSISLEEVVEALKSEVNASPKEKEPVTFTTLTPEEKEKMMSDAIGMSEEQWMKKYQVGDHGDYLRMAKSKWNID